MSSGSVPTVPTSSLPTDTTPTPTPSSPTSPPPTSPSPSTPPPPSTPSPPPPESPSPTPNSPPSSQEPSTSSDSPQTTSTSSDRETSSATSTPTKSSTSSPSDVTVTLTSTASVETPSDTVIPPTGNLPATTSSFSSLPTSSSPPSHSEGLSPGGTIAVAVVVPVVSVALIIIALIIFWRKRKARKLAEEERKQEIEEYGYNPNADPTLPVVGAAGAYTDGPGADDEDGSNVGYRGWGATAQGSHKISTTNPSSGGDGGYRGVSPVDDTAPYADDDHRPVSSQEQAGNLQTMPMAGAAVTGNRADIHRGPSNASSAYSNANRSDVSDDLPAGAPLGSQYYDDDPAYYNSGAQQGSYGDMTYQPVIRDVQARRNTRIETPTVVPQHGNAGISQNF